MNQEKSPQDRSAREKNVRIELKVICSYNKMMKPSCQFTTTLKFKRSWYQRIKFIRTVAMEIFMETKPVNGCGKVTEVWKSDQDR